MTLALLLSVLLAGRPLPAPRVTIDLDVFKPDGSRAVRVKNS